MATRVLVTGAAGYLGSVLCEHLLDAGYQVVGLDSLLYGQSGLFHLCHNPNFDFLQGDARDEALLRRVEAEQELLGSPNAITLRLATVFGMSPRMRLDLLVNDFVYKAVTDRYLVIFEKDFKRNFVHIRDVADCFLHCLAHA